MKTKSRRVICVAATIGLGLLPFLLTSASTAKDPGAHITLIRALKTRKLGIKNPAGLAFSMNEQVFHVVESRGPSQPPSADCDVILITARPAHLARTRIPATITDPINIAFDNAFDRLLVLLPGANILMQVKAGPDGRLNPDTLSHFDVRSFNLQDPQGMAVDPASGDLLILDSAVSSIVRLTPDPEGNFDRATVSRVDLQYIGSAALRGLAVNPAGGHLYVLDNTHHALYELTSAGQVIAIRDLSTFHLKDPRGMVFAPSGDLTDNPSQMSLYLADSGLAAAKNDQAVSPGQVMELSLDALAEAGARTYQSTLIRTTNLAALSPPSQDPSGLTFVSARNSLLMSDGEVEEKVSGITHFQGANLWELTLTGGIIRTANISSVAPTSVPMTDEPTGAAWNPGNGHYYFSDDNDLEIWDLNPGGDGLLGTSDDTWTSFSTHGAGDDDPEGITYDPSHDRLFVADGDNREIYEYTTTGTLVSHFDVLQYGVVDPESVEFDAATGTLFVLGNASSGIVAQTTPGGALLQTIDVSEDNAVAPAGLAYAPASSGSAAKHFYIVDRGVDNNDNPNIVDGKMYEMTSPTITPGNLPPIVSAGADQTITRSESAHLSGSVSDDGIPGGSVSSAWSKVSGSGTATFSDGSSPTTTATFSAIGNYVLRLTADDGELVSTDEVNIAVTGDNGELPIEVRVAASADDAEESSSGSVSLSSGDLELVYDGSNQTVGMRFNGISIPKGSTITSAYVQFTVDESQAESTTLTIQGQNVDQATTFSTQSKNISSRARTVAAVSWSPNPWATIGAAGADQQTPNIASVIQEIVGRSGWASGNSLAIIISGTGHRTAQAYNLAPTAAPLLHVEYRPPTTNHAPVAVADAYSTNEDTPLVVAAKGVLANDTDADGDALTALLEAGPSHGTLTLDAAGGFTYAPALNFNGSDSFTYHANDGKASSNVATVTITVNLVNDAPVANHQSVTTAQDTAKAITLTGSDVDGDALTYAIVAAPAHGTLTGAAPNVTYTPAASYNGSDSFTFKVNDGKVDSAPATVSITVASVNHPPVANPQSVTTAQDTAKATTLTGSDVDGDALTYTIVAAPAHGTLTGTAPNVTYTPNASYSGADGFTFKVNDGKVDSAPATVSITVISSGAPIITSLSPASVLVGGAAFTLTVNGNNFVAGSLVRWNGSNRTTTFVSSQQLTAAISASDIAAPKTVQVTVYSPAPVNATSNAQTFIVNNPSPATTSLSPAAANSRGAGFTLSAYGSGYVASSVIRWNGVDMPTDFSSATRVKTTIPAAAIAVAGTATVTVFTPAPGGSISNPLTFTINDPPAPTVTDRSPFLVTAGGGDFTLTVSGTNFVSDSVVRLNGATRTTTFVSSTKLTATILASDIAAVGTYPATVYTPAPGGGLSNSKLLYVGYPVPTTTGLSPATASAGGGAFTLTVDGSNYEAASVVRWNGVNVATTFVSSSRVTAVIPSSKIAVAGTAQVTVYNPATGGGGGTSNAQTFTIN